MTLTRSRAARAVLSGAAALVLAAGGAALSAGDAQAGPYAKVFGPYGSQGSCQVAKANNHAWVAKSGCFTARNPWGSSGWYYTAEHI